MGPFYSDFYARASTVFKVIIVVCATLHFYYIVLHFDEEVEYIWSRKWSVGKAMYLLARYLGTFFLICTVIGVWRYPWYDTCVLLPCYDVTYGFFESCFYGKLFTGLGPMAILVAEEILMMRVYALYGKSKKLLIFFVLLSAFLFAFNILQLSFLFIGLEYNVCAGGGCFRKRALARRSFIAGDNHSSNACMAGPWISGIAWAVTFSVELLLFLLVAIKAGVWDRLISITRKSNRRSSQTCDVTTIMAKDSLVYFAVFFCACVVGMVIVFAFEHCNSDIIAFIGTELHAYETMVVTIMTILAPKLILNLRAAYYGPPKEIATHLTWNVQIPVLSTTDGGSESVYTRDELGSFMD